MRTSIVLLVLAFGIPLGHATEACAPVDEELALWDRAESSIEALPKIFRYTVTIDDRRHAFITEPRCVVSAREDHESWLKYVARGNLLLLFWNWSLDVEYPAWVDFDGGKADWHRVVLERASAVRGWFGRIVRDAHTKHPFALSYEVPDCAEIGESYSAVLRRLEDGRVISGFYRRKQIERIRAKCPKANGT